MVSTRILCESVCFYDICSKKQRKLAVVDDFDKNFNLKKGAKWRVEKNKHYINPKYRPKWCIKYNKKRVPQFYCMGQIGGGMKCPFLIISNCRKKEYEFMEMGLKILEDECVKKYGKMFDYDDAMPRSKREIDLHIKILKEFEKDKSFGLLRRKPLRK